MAKYVGLDVSLEEVSICVMDGVGKSVSIDFAFKCQCDLAHWISRPL